MSGNRKFWSALGDSENQTDVAQTLPGTLLTALPRATVSQHHSPSETLAPSASTAIHTRSPPQDVSDAMFLRRWQPHTPWTGDSVASAPTTAPAPQASPSTATPPRALPPTPRYGDTSSASYSSATPYSAEYSYSYTYSSYSGHDNQTDDDREDGEERVRGRTTSTSVTSSSSPRSTPPHNHDHMNQDVRQEPSTLHAKPLMRFTPPLPVTPNATVEMAIAPPRASSSGEHIAAATVSTVSITEAATVAAVNGFPVSRASGIQILRCHRPARATPSPESTLPSPPEATHALWSEQRGSGVVQRRRHTSGEEEEEEVAKTVMHAETGFAVPTRADAEATRVSSAACLGQLPSSSSATAPRRANQPTHTTATFVSPRSNANPVGPPPSRSGVVAPSHSSSSSSCSSSPSPSRARVDRYAGEDPLAYQPPRIPLRSQMAVGIGSTPSHDVHAETNTASSSADGACTCCSACASHRRDGSCCEGCDDDCSCRLRHHSSADDGASRRTSLSEFALVSHEAHRKQQAIDPFSKLGPAAPALLRLGQPRQIAETGTLSVPGPSAPPPFPTRMMGPSDDEESHLSDDGAETPREPSVRGAVTVSVATQVDESSLTPVVTAASSSSATAPDAEAWKRLVESQTTTLQAQWQAWAAELTQQQHDTAQRQAEAEAQRRQQQEEQDRHKHPETTESGCSPHVSPDTAALAFVEAAARDESAQALHALLANLYHSTPEARDAETYRQSELAASEERTRQTAEQLATVLAERQNLFTELLVSLEVSEAEQRLLLLGLEADTRQVVVAPAWTSVCDAYTKHEQALEAARHTFTQRLLSDMLRQQLQHDVLDAERHARQVIEMAEQAARFGTIAPDCYAQHHARALEEATHSAATLADQVSQLERQKALLEQQCVLLQRQDAERRVALAEALRQPTITLASHGTSANRSGASVTGSLRMRNGDGDDHGGNDVDDDDLPVHRRFARAHQEALKAVRAQSRRV